jgi:hypothetical protein
MALDPLEVWNRQDWPTLIQFSVFLENRVGQLQEVVSLIERSDVQVAALSVQDSSDHAVARLVVTDTARVRSLLSEANLPTAESEIVAVQIPAGLRPLTRVCQSLLRGELNINYVYPILLRSEGYNGLALQVEDTATAAQLLDSAGFRILSEGDLS